MIAYLDSSVILRLVLGQPDRLREWGEVDEGVTGALAEVECLRTLDRLRPSENLADEEIARRRRAWAGGPPPGLPRGIFKCIFNSMPIHARVLDAALRICRGRRGWTFRPAEIVAALPDLNASSVRTHVMSRCCVNAPPHHPHRWPYFRRVERGVYKILPAVRGRRPGAAGVAAPASAGRPPARGAAPAGRGPQETLLSVEIRESGGRYVAGSPTAPLEVEGTSLESVLSRVVRLARERLRKAGGPPVRLSAELRFEAHPGLEPSDPLLAAYANDIDRTLIRENLRLSVEERLEKLQGWAEAMDEIRGAAWRSRRGEGAE